MSAMAEMSRAIRLQIEAHAPTLQQLDNETLLRQFAQIGAAYALDLQAEVVRRDADKRAGRVTMNAPVFITAPDHYLRAPLTYSFNVQGKTLDALGAEASAKAVALLGEDMEFDCIAFDVRGITNLDTGEAIAYEADVTVRVS